MPSAPTPAPTKIEVERPLMLALLERVEWLDRLHVMAEEIYNAFPAYAKERLQTMRNPGMYDVDVAVAMANTAPPRREELHRSTREWKTVINGLLAGASGKFVGNLTPLVVANAIRVMSVFGTKTIREVERFVEAFDANDTAYLVVKVARGKAEASYARNLPVEVVDTLGLKHVG